MSVATSRASDLIDEYGFVSGQSEGISIVNAVVWEISASSIPVLVCGESGTGKDVYGRLIHQLSRQKELPLIKVNCRVVEPETFVARTKKTLSQADEFGGTLLLDGIDELDLDCQRVMIAMLQEREEGLGGPASLRLVSTATRDLDRAVLEGRLRRELYFRVNGVCLRLPSLRHRKADIVPLAEYFLEKHAAEAGKRTPVLRREDEELLLAHDWPGNVRELENLARRIVALGESSAAMKEFEAPQAKRENIGPGERPASLKVVAREASRVAERELILKALERTHWNRKQAARQLQISYKALLYKIKQMEVNGPELKNEGEER